MARDLNRSIKIYIDNSDAMKNVENLEKSMSSLRSEMQKLDAEGKKETQTYANKEKQLRNQERTYASYQNKVQETQRVLKNLSGSTYRELLQVRRAVRADLNKSQRGTVEYTQKLKIYNQVQKEIKVAQVEMNGQLGAQSSLWSRMTASFNKYFGIISTFAASITGLSLAFRKLSQDAAAMEDVYDGVSKTTGLTRDQVMALNEEFKKMDTRVSREELNKFAEAAGKLGRETEEDILGFVSAAARIRVGIGSDLGDDALTDIAKMTDIFAHSTREMERMNLEERMIATGSAIRYLAKQSTAAEPPMVAFASRMTGIASQANISMQDILGFGSALDQLKQPTEMAATAMQKMIMKMFTDTSTYADIAGMSLDEFNTLLTTDTNEAIKTVLRALNAQGGFDQLAPIFEDMGLSGARAVGVLSALAANIDMVDQAQQDANKSFAEATTLDEEYNIMNTNAQAALEKRRQAFKDAAEDLGKRLNPALLKSTNMMTYVIKFLPDILDLLQKYGRFILSLAKAYIAYNVGVRLAAFWNDKLSQALKWTNIQLALKNTWLKTTRIATLAYAAAQALLTGNITRMRAAWRMLTATMATNPIGMVAVAITAAISGVIRLVKWINRTDEATKALKETSKQFQHELASETRAANELFEAFKNTNEHTDLHLQLKDEIISKYGKYIDHLIDEEGNITNIGDALIIVNTALREQIALKIRNQAVDEMTASSLSNQLDATDKAINRISKQVDGSMLGPIRRSINETLAVFSSSEYKDYDALQRNLISDLQQTFGVDAHSSKWWFGSVKDAISDLVDEIEKGDVAIEAINERFDGLITEQLNLEEFVVTAKAKNKKEADAANIASDKDLYKEKLAALDHYLNEEREKLMRSYLSREITHAQYLHQLEQLERDALNTKLNIYEFDIVKQQEVTNQILELRLKLHRMLEQSEREHAEKIKELNKEVEQSRQDSNWASLKSIAQQNKEEWERQERLQNEMIADMMQDLFAFSNDLGTMLGGFISGNEDMVASSLKNIINMALDLLKVQVQMAIAGATAQSLAQPDSVATFGASGLARAAVLVGLIEAAFAGVKGVVSSALNNMGGKSASLTGSNSSTSTTSRVVDQRFRGKYDVIGADDGRHYSVPYLGPARTGVVTSPALVGEYGSELIISAPDFSRLQRHMNYPLILRAIQESRVPQRAQGNYSALPPAPPSSDDSATVHQDQQLMTELLRLLQTLNREGVHASVDIHAIRRANRRLDNIDGTVRR